MTPRDVFISHSSDDAESARDLRTILENAGYSCWMAPDDIVGTDTWTEQILDAIHSSRAMIVLVSTASNASPHVAREVNLALGRRRAVLPIRIESVAPGGSLEYLLSLVQRVDAFPPPISTHGDRILRRLGTVIERSADAGSTTQAHAQPATTTPVAQPQPAPPPVQPSPPPVAQPQPAPPPPITVPGGAGARSGRALLPIAGVAIAVVAAAAVGVSLLGGPKSSPSPSDVAVATPTFALPTSGDTTPAFTTGPTGAPLSADEARLVSLLPMLEAAPPVCTSWATPPGGDDVLSPSGYAGSVARLTCPGPTAGAAPIRYALYQDGTSLDAAFVSIMGASSVAEGGACRDAIPANAPWNFTGDPNSGKLACFERDGKVQYVWTHAQLRLLVQWLAPDNATGFAFWTRWTTTYNAAEQALLALLPATVDDNGACVRAADLYYFSATAILDCRTGANTAAAYYASFPAGNPFPNDPMTTTFDQLMTMVQFPDDTKDGCLSKDPVYGRTTWVFGTDTTTQGYIGCYERTDAGLKTSQIIWTYNPRSIMGLWDAPDLATGVDFFKTWTAGVH